MIFNGRNRVYHCLLCSQDAPPIATAIEESSLGPLPEILTGKKGVTTVIHVGQGPYIPEGRLLLRQAVS